MASQFFVVSAPSFDGERFVILRPGTIPSSELVDSCAGDVWPEPRTWSRYAVELLTENEARQQLEVMGLSDEDVDDQIRRARAMAGPCLLEGRPKPVPTYYYSRG